MSTRAAAPAFEPRLDLVGDPEVEYLSEPPVVVRNKDVRQALRIIGRMDGFVEKYEPLLVSKKGPKRTHCTFEGLIVALVINVVLKSRAPFLSEAAVTLYESMPKKWRKRFGSFGHPIVTVLDRNAAIKAVERLYNKFRLLVDSQPVPHGRKLTIEELEEIKKLFPCPEDAAKMDAELAWLCNRILGSAVVTGLNKIMPGWQKADLLYGLDATFFNANGNLPATSKGMCSVDCQAGFYKRDKDEPPPVPLLTKKGAPRRRKHAAQRMVDALEWGYEDHILRLTVNPLSEYRDQVEMPVGFYLDRPGFAPDLNGLGALDAALETGLPPGTIAFDSAYIKELFLQGAMDRGFGVLFDPFASNADAHDDYLGAMIVGGRPCCPGVEPELLQINRDYHLEKIDKATMFARAESLQVFRPRVKDTLPDGRIRVSCPAKAPSGRAARCNCDLLDERTDGVPEVPYPPGVKREDSETADGVLRRDLKKPGLLCTKGSILVNPQDLVKVWQEDAHRTPDWRMNYAAGRNATERGHSHMKAGYGEALAIADRRCVRGRANGWILSAFLLAAHAIRLTRSWFRNAEREPVTGVIIGPPKKNRRGPSRRPWHSPLPGAPLAAALIEEAAKEPYPPPEPPPEPVVCFS